MSLNVRVITPDKVVWDAKVDELILPSSTGQIGILTDHAPLLTALDIGVMRLKSETNWTSIVLMEGFAEVEENKVTILCNGAEEGSSIDLKTAQEELEKVTLLVDEATTKKEKIEATIELRKAKARLQAVARWGGSGRSLFFAELCGSGSARALEQS
jgi:F-type H+-transporting ATPase subunit epsilon